jgi:hypothetical protein
MKSLHLAAIVLVAGTAAAQTPPATVRVGTFHQPSVVTAFYRSPFWADQIKRKMAEREAARSANDTKKIQELEAWGSGSQELAHRQLAGEAPIANILEYMAAAMPQIAKRARVTAVVAGLLYSDPNIETVDVTPQILDWFQADEATRRMVRELQQLPPRKP